MREIKFTPKLVEINAQKTEYMTDNHTKNTDLYHLNHIASLHLTNDGYIPIQDLLFLKPKLIIELSNFIYRCLANPHRYVSGLENLTQRYLILLTFLRCLDAKLKGKNISHKIQAYQNFAKKLGVDMFSSTLLAKETLTEMPYNGNTSVLSWNKKDKSILTKLLKAYPALFERSYWTNPNFFNQAEFERMINVVAKVILEINKK
jgi:hypothetical protein